MGSGVRRPREPVPGTDVAGVVASVGSAVTRFKPGDEVFGETVRGVQWRNGGAFAEYATAPEVGVALKPPSVGFEEAAAVPTAGLIALKTCPNVGYDGFEGLGQRRRGRRRRDRRAARQGIWRARHRCRSLEQAHARALPRRGPSHRLHGRGLHAWRRAGDLIFDVPGNNSFRATRRALDPRGSYILIGHDAFGATGHRWLGSIPRLLGLVARSAVSPQLRGGSFAPPDKRELMDTLARFVESDQLRVVVDRTYPLSQAPQAMQHLMSGRPVGRIVLRIDD